HHHRANGADRSSTPSGHAPTATSGPAALRPVAGGDADGGEVDSPKTDHRSCARPWRAQARLAAPCRTSRALIEDFPCKQPKDFLRLTISQDLSRLR